MVASVEARESAEDNNGENRENGAGSFMLASSWQFKGIGAP